jgi:chemotaxis protein MotB
MTQSNSSEAAATGSTTATTHPGIVLTMLAGLFAAGLALLYTLTGGGEIHLAGSTSSAKVEEQAESDRQARVEEPTAEAAEFATSSMLAALEAQLAEARARIDALSEQAVGFEATSTRVDRLEADIAEAKSAADAAARQAAQVAQRYSALMADYAKVGAQFTPDGVLIRLDESAVAFQAGAAVLPADADIALTEVAGFLLRHPGQRALLRGHTDASGRADANRCLSEQRAASVRAVLVAMGVPVDRIGIEGVGAAEPIADNASAAGRSRNRRVEVLLSAPEGVTG